MFSIWNDQNNCLDWEKTKEWIEMLDLVPVPILYEGEWDGNLIKNLEVDTESFEGYVVRNAGSFPFDEFQQNVAKWVREDHVATDEHWMFQPIIPNLLSEESE